MDYETNILNIVCDCCGGPARCSQDIYGKTYQCPFKASDGTCEGVGAYSITQLYELLSFHLVDGMYRQKGMKQHEGKV